MSRCDHESVGRADAIKDRPFWKCDRCNAEFLPVFVVAGMISEEAERVMSVATAILWDMHERAVERYGAGSPEEEALRPGHDAPEDDEPCEEHHFANGVCINPGCGASQFLGGDN